MAKKKSSKDIYEIASSRMNETIINDYRNFQLDYYEGDWKTRIENQKLLYAGKWDMVYPDESSARMLPKVMNLVQAGMDDLARLVNEVKPQVKVPPRTSGVDANARLKEKVYDTYWLANRGPVSVPKYALDLLGAGFAAFAITADEARSEYPIFTRLDSYAVFPTLYNEEMVDCLVRQKVKGLTANNIFGKDLGFDPGADVEILDYYDDMQIARFVAERYSNSTLGNPKEADRVIHDLGVVPIAWAALPTFDGTFRGVFDQISGSLLAENRIVQLMLDYATELVYSPWEYYNVENPDDVPGPKTKYRLMTPDGFMRRIPPGTNSPMLLEILQFIDDAMRGGVGYPRSRGGTVPQSIASASFVSATLGQLATTVKSVQGEIGNMREMANKIAAKIDQKMLNNEKRLLVASDDTREYTPKSVFKDDDYNNNVLYGAGAGLDAVNKKLALLQDVQSRLVSRKTAMEQLDYIQDVKQEMDRINQEMFEEAFGQKGAMGADLLLLTNILSLFDQGKGLSEIAGILSQYIEAQQAEQQAAATGQTPPQQPGPQAAAPSAAEQQVQLEKGSVQPVPVGPVNAGPPNVASELIARPVG